MRWPRPPRDGERGAAVLLFVALVVAAAIAATASMMIGRPQFAVQQGTNTGFDLTALRKAVEAHAVLSNYNLPNPAVDANGGAGGAAGAVGLVPWRTIGVTKRQATDAWGNMVSLAVPTTGKLSLDNANPAVCDFILISHGPNGAGATTAGGTVLAAPAANTREAANLNITNGFWTLPDPDNANDTFDDIAVCGKLGSAESNDSSVHSLYTPADGQTAADNFTRTNDTNNHIAPRFKVPPHVDWAVSDEIMYFGGASNDPDTYDLTASNITRAACAWYNTPFDFADETLRGFIRFQFLPGEASTNQTTNTGQGFSLMVIPGERTVSANSCGTAAADNSFGFKGVARPKFALEFDIYRDTYELATDYSGGRNNPNPEGNHVALLNPLTNDYISHGGSGNPRCQIWGPNGNGPADGDWPGACTYPAASAIDRPDRHATRPANWLENGQYVDAALGQNAAQPYVVRFEFKRLCNADCSTCGVEGGTMVHAKAWIACDAEALDGNPGACPVFTDDFQNVTESYAETTDYMVDHCMNDRSLSYPAESFDTVKIGIGFSTRNSAVALLLHRFEANSE